jgi:hypothetical protein
LVEIVDAVTGWASGVMDLLRIEERVMNWRACSTS